MTRQFDPGTLEGHLQLVSPDAGTSLLLHDAITAPPEVAYSIDGASTLTIQVNDQQRRLARSEAFTTRSWAQALDMNFELVSARKSGDQVTLTFEDAIAAAMRREKKTRRWPARSVTRRQVGVELAKGAGVKYSIDPADRKKIQDKVERAGGTTSWDLAGTLATDIGWRRFSNGHQLVMGSDEWLIDQDKNPTRIQERTGPFGDVDFDTDQGKRAATATVILDAEAGALAPGGVCLIEDDYPATDGKWLVSEYRHRLTRTTATLTLTRKQRTLKEPKGTGGPGDRGDNTFAPDRGGDSGGGRATNSAREKMVTFALAQAGDTYVMGGNGPSAWDCSGLVQAATAHAGRQLGKPSASQWTACESAGVTIPVAEALKIRGALLFRIGVAEYNHVAISLGNGSTIEAMGSAYGVLVAGGAADRGWTGAALWL